MAEKIAIRRLGKTFRSGKGAVEALRDVSLSVEAGRFVAIVGASGCGKSTLLRIVGGLEPRGLGEILVNGTPIVGPARDRAMVFQDYSLYPWLTVLGNIRFCRRLAAHTARATSAEVADAVERSLLLLELTGLGRVRDAYPGGLSGGMRQRVAIARALMSRPELLLMDEPFGALDAQTREVMHELILHVVAVERPTVLFVTHDVEEAIYLADRVVVLAPSPGRIDSVWPVTGFARAPDAKLAPEFLQLKRRILERIRATSEVRGDLQALERLTRAGASMA